MRLLPDIIREVLESVAKSMNDIDKEKKVIIKFGNHIINETITVHNKRDN